MSKIKPGKFVIENIFFEFNKFELQPASITELEKVYKMLDLNKDIEVEISGHTDSDGNDQDNMVLSENRAQAVVDWLVEKVSHLVDYLSRVMEKLNPLLIILQKKIRLKTEEQS